MLPLVIMAENTMAWVGILPQAEDSQQDRCCAAIELTSYRTVADPDGAAPEQAINVP